MIALERIEQAIDIAALKAAEVVVFIDVVRRWTNHGQSVEAAWLLNRGKRADHGTDRMTDEMYSPIKLESGKNLQNIPGVTAECAVPRLVECGGL